MNASASRKFNVKNINLNNQSYFSDSDSENYPKTSEMTNLKENDGFITPPPKKVARQTPSTNTKPTQTKNKYGVLEKVEEMETTTNVPAKQPTTTKKQWVPPIIILSQIQNYKLFNQQITSILGHGNFRVFYRNTGTKVLLQSMTDRAKLMLDLDENKLNFHTFTPNEEKCKKIVLKGAPEMDIDEVKENLIKQGSAVDSIIKLKTRRQQESFSYLVTVKKEQSLQDIKKIRNIDQCGIKWEKYNKKNTYTQCFNCQAFGHAEINCHQRSRCVKCPSNHHWKQCTLKKTENSKAYCHNCHGDHAASFKNCPTLLEYLQKRNESALARQGGQQKPATTIPLEKTAQQQRIEEPRPGPSSSTYTGTNNFTNENVKRSYRDVLQNKYIEDTNTSNNLNSNNEELGELLELLNIVKNIKYDLKNCKNQFEKMSVIIKYLDKF